MWVSHQHDANVRPPTPRRADIRDGAPVLGRQSDVAVRCDAGRPLCRVGNGWRREWDVFVTYVERILVVVMDNLGAHLRLEVHALIEAQGAVLMF